MWNDQDGGSAVADDAERARIPRWSWPAAVVFALLLYPLSRQSYPVFHTFIEMLSVAIGWGAFLLLWNARRYLEQKAFLIFGAALFAAGILDLAHTMAYRGFDVFAGFDAVDLATQFWIAARTVETLGWLVLALLLHRRSLATGPLLAALGALTALAVLSILVWRGFPRCFVPGQGLTPFKIVTEVALALVMTASLLLLRRRDRGRDPLRARLLQIALGLSIAAEIAFTFYQDVFGIGNLVGHYLRLIARYLVYLALVRMSIVNPYALFFRRLQEEKEAVAASESRWRSFTGSSPDHVLDLDGEGRIRFVNRPPDGWSIDGMMGRRVVDLVPEADRVRVTQALDEVRATGERRSFEVRHVASSGRYQYFDVGAVPRAGRPGEGDGIMLVARDVTQRTVRDMVLQARLRISDFALQSGIEELLQNVLDEAEALTDSRIGFFHSVEPDQEHLHLQAWSTRTLAEACRAEGQDRHYPLNKAGVWADCVRRRAPLIHNDYASLPDRKGMPPGHAAVVREVVVPVFREGRVVAALGVGNRATDYAEDDVRLLTDLADLAWDIVTRKRAELELKESERRLARTLANVPGMVFRCDNDEHWTMRFVSDGCRDLTGYEGHELRENRVASYASLIHPDDRAMVDAAVQASLPQRRPYQITYRIIPRDASLRWVWERGQGVYRGDRLEALEGFIYDITALVEAQRERQALEKKVLEAQKLESLGVLAGGIAHDFNNLLQSVLGFAELAEDQVGTGQDPRRSLGMIVKAATRAADLTRQMLTFSGQGHISVGLVKLNDLVEDMAALLQTSVPRSIDFRRELDPDLPAVLADSAQIQQVIMNLITNAAEAVGEGDGAILLRTGQLACDEEFLAGIRFASGPAAPRPAPGPYVFCEVRDTGCGMDQATVARIFEPFFTTKFTGRGLGLAAVLGIVRGHKGLITIDSNPGEGTRIRVLLPAARLETAAAGLGADDAEDTGDRPVRPRVLVVDDEPGVIEVVRGALGVRGVEVVEARDGYEALVAFSASPDIACVILDVVMPRMGGHECLARLRGISPDVPVILISGYAEHEIRERFADLQVHGVLAKPFRGRQLLEVLRQVAPGLVKV